MMRVLALKQFAVTAILLLLSLPAFADIRITNFFDTQPIRANNGEIVVEVQSTKKFTLYIDNVEVKSVRPRKEFTRLVIKDVDRGTHILRATSADDTYEVTIHVLRTHI